MEQSKKQRVKDAAQKTAAALLAIAVWQAAASAIGSSLLLASPVAVLRRLAVIWTESGFWSVVWFSFLRITGGFFIALAAGILLAVAASRSKVLETLMWPFMITIKSVPVASFIVISLIWLSSRQLSVFISFLMVLPIIYTNILQGIKSADKQLMEMARIYHMPWSRRLAFISLPASRPFVFSACSVSLGLCWKAGVAAEVIGIPDGSIGEALYMSKVYLDTASLLAWTVIIVLISVLFEKLFTALLRYAFKALEKL